MASGGGAEGGAQEGEGPEEDSSVTCCASISATGRDAGALGAAPGPVARCLLALLVFFLGGAVEAGVLSGDAEVSAHRGPPSFLPSAVSEDMLCSISARPNGGDSVLPAGSVPGEEVGLGGEGTMGEL
jgi:hypothetical protein